MNSNTEKLLINLHIKFLKQFLKSLPRGATDFEPMRPTIIFFIISSLDLLNALDTLTSEEKSEICNWIYRLQIAPRNDSDDEVDQIRTYGFNGSHTLIFNGCDAKPISEYNVGHLGMTFSSLCSLVVLGDDLSRVNRIAILKAISHLQNENGSFYSSLICGENDIRFVYCAVVICYILNDMSHINVSKCIDFITKCISYDGAIALKPGLESHGGSSFCGIASLFLLEQFGTSMSDKQIKSLQRWLILRQDSGFQGRPHKEVDTCYSFWVGAALKLIESFSLVNWEENRKSIMNCQNKYIGGFSKYSYSQVDLMHTYFSICGLSLMEEPGVQEMYPALNMSMRAYRHLKKIHEIWTNDKSY